MTDHSVRLPHPYREGFTVATCTCGWTISYRWGEHGDAAHDATEHIRTATSTEPFEAADMSGSRLIMPGRSL